MDLRKTKGLYKGKYFQNWMLVPIFMSVTTWDYSNWPLPNMFEGFLRWIDIRLQGQLDCTCSSKILGRVTLQSPRASEAHDWFEPKCACQCACSMRAVGIPDSRSVLPSTAVRRIKTTWYDLNSVYSSHLIPILYHGTGSGPLHSSGPLPVFIVIDVCHCLSTMCTWL